MLGLGLDRGKIGDIQLSETGAVMYVSNEVADFIQESLHEVGRTTVTAARHQDTADIKATGIMKRVTVASLRLDTVISTALHLSRTKAAALIDAEKVYVNWAIAKKTYQLAIGDIVTIRGAGRVRLDEIIGHTKKDRIAINIEIFA